MPTRIADYASQRILFSYLNNVNKRMQDLQMQITTEKRSQTYMGIGYDTQRLVGYEVEVQAMDRFKRNNEIKDVYIKAAETTTTGILDTVSNFRQILTGPNSKVLTDENSIRSLQGAAMDAMKFMQSFLNQDVNGRYLFGGNKITDEPVDLGNLSLEAFQAKYDGINMHYPDTREKHLEDFNFTKDTNGRTNWLTFTQDKDGVATTSGIGTITSTTAQFTNVTIGTIIKVSGTKSNDGSYEVAAVTNGGTTIEINTKMLTDEAAVTTAKLKSTTSALIDANTFTNLTFNRAAGTISAAAGSLSAFKAGDTITVSGTAQNDGVYVVESLPNNTTIKIREAKLTDEGTATTPFHQSAADTLTFDAANSQITSATANQFGTLKQGMKITIGGTVDNNGTFTVASVSTDGKTITVLETVTTETGVAGDETFTVSNTAGTVEADTYYKGDHLTHSHRVSKTGDFVYDLNAADTAFEKAIRAMGIIAQGKFGTDGGLDHPDNQHRLSDAVHLLDLAMTTNAPANPKYEAGYTNNLQYVVTELGYQRTLLQDANDSHTQLTGFYSERVSQLEDKDKLEAVLSFLDDQRALEASYQAMSSIRGLNLHNFLR